MARAFEIALTRFAQAASRPEIAHLPFVAGGVSRNGVWSQDMALALPARAIAYANVSGWVATPKTDAERAVPALFVLGSETDPKEPWKMLDDVLKQYDPGRKAGNPWGLAIQWGENEHATGNNVVLAMPFFESMIRLRLPADAKPAAGPVALLPVAAASGWLADRTNWRVVTMEGKPTSVVRVELTAKANFATVAPYDEFEGDKAAAIWLPDGRVAATWRAFESRLAPLVLQAAAGTVRLPATGQRRMVVNPGTAVALSVTAAAGALPPLKSLQFHDGDQTIGPALKAAPFSTTWTPTTPGAHPLFAIWEDAQGNTGTTSAGLVVVRTP